MDLSDDIAYSVHDFEDAVVSGYIDPELLTLRSGLGALIRANEKPRHAAGFPACGCAMRGQSSGVMFDACAPFGPWVTS